MEKNRTNPIGTLPSDPETCAILRNRQGDIICEAYAYRVGFFRFNWHASLEIMFVLEGRLRAFTQRGEFELSEGDFICIRPNEGHASMVEVPGTVAAVLHISQAYLEKLCEVVPPISCMYCGKIPRDNDYIGIKHAFASIYSLLATDGGLASRISAEAALMSIIGILVRQAAPGENCGEKNPITSQQKQKLMEIHRQIERRYQDKITLKNLAEAVGMNPSYLSSFFARCMQMGLHEYIARKRLAMAVWELNNSDDTILEIAVSAGFPDAKSLYGAFRKYFGMTPNEYRRQLSTRTDMTVRNHIPTRFQLNDPYVLEKIR